MDSNCSPFCTLPRKQPLKEKAKLQTHKLVELPQMAMLRTCPNMTLSIEQDVKSYL